MSPPCHWRSAKSKNTQSGRIGGEFIKGAGIPRLKVPPSAIRRIRSPPESPCRGLQPLLCRHAHSTTRAQSRPSDFLAFSDLPEVSSTVGERMIRSGLHARIWRMACLRRGNARRACPKPPRLRSHSPRPAGHLSPAFSVAAVALTVSLFAVPVTVSEPVVGM
jgi:hypothetical protein